MSHAFEAQGEALIIELRRLQRAVAAHEADREMPAQQRTEAHAGIFARTLKAPFAFPQTPMGLAAHSIAGRRYSKWVRRSLGAMRSAADFLLARGAFSRGAGAASSDWIEHLGSSFQSNLRTAMRVLMIGGLVAGGCGVLIPLSGALVLPARLVVESHVKDIQHPTGGVVATIAVHDGTHVKAGDVLLTLDRTQVEANYRMYLNQFRELEMRIARLTAERDGSDLVPPAGLAGPGDDKDVRKIVSSERSLFEARHNALASQVRLLKNNVDQYNQQLAGLQAQIDSKISQSELIANELSGVQQLFDKGLVPLTRLSALKREMATLTGDRGQLQSSMAETKAKIDQALLQTVKIDQDFRAEATKDLADSQVRLSDVSQKLVSIRDELTHLNVRAPIGGIVHELSAHTVAGVIRPGEVMMKIVPDTDAMEVEAHLPPKDVDQVRMGQSVSVKFPSQNYQMTPELSGVVKLVSPDVTTDKTTSNSFYTLRITISEAERAKLHNIPLTSGMPVEAFLRLHSRTMMSYLLKPLADQFHRMFTEP